MRAHERIAECRATDPPSAAQERREFAPTVQARKDAPRRAAEPVSASRRPQAEVLAGPPGGEALPERGRVVHLVCLSQGPCHLRALCAVVQRLGKGHRDRHPLMTQVRAEASLSARRTSRAAAYIAAINNEATR